MNNISQTKMLIVFILVANILGGLIYFFKSNLVGIFNCVSWAVVASFILFNFDTVFNQRKQ